MNKKLAAALSGGAVLILTLSGCGGDKNEVNKDLVAWAGKLCSDLPALKAKIDTASDSIQKVSSNGLPPKEVQQTLSQAFQEQADGYKGIADAISAAGVPPGVDEGATKQQNAVTALTALSTSYAGLKTKTDALDTKSEGKFSVGLEAVASDLKTLKTSDTALTDLETGEVKRAMAEQDSCKQTAVPSAPASESASVGGAGAPSGAATPSGAGAGAGAGAGSASGSATPSASSTAG